MKYSIIAAHNTKGVIGKDGEMPWYSRDDMAWFKEHTFNKPVIMGRKTWESIPEKFRPLPNRTNIIVSSTMNVSDGDYYVVRSFQEATVLAEQLIAKTTNSDTMDSLEPEIMYMGGQTIYEQAIGLCDALYLTEVKNDSDGDAFFPEVDMGNFHCTFENKENDLVTFRIYEKVVNNYYNEEQIDGLKAA